MTPSSPFLALNTLALVQSIVLAVAFGACVGCMPIQEITKLHITLFTAGG